MALLPAFDDYGLGDFLCGFQRQARNLDQDRLLGAIAGRAKKTETAMPGCLFVYAWLLLLHGWVVEPSS